MTYTLAPNDDMTIEPGRMYWHRAFGYAVRVIEYTHRRMVRYQRINSDVTRRVFLVTPSDFRKAYTDDAAHAPLGRFI